MKLNAKQRLTAIADYKAAAQSFNVLKETDELLRRVGRYLDSSGRAYSDKVFDKMLETARKHSKDSRESVQQIMQYLGEEHDL